MAAVGVVSSAVRRNAADARATVPCRWELGTRARQLGQSSQDLEQFLLQPGVQDHVRRSGHALGPHLARGRSGRPYGRPDFNNQEGTPRSSHRPRSTTSPETVLAAPSFRAQVAALCSCRREGYPIAELF